MELTPLELLYHVLYRPSAAVVQPDGPIHPLRHLADVLETILEIPS